MLAFTAWYPHTLPQYRASRSTPVVLNPVSVPHRVPPYPSSVPHSTCSTPVAPYPSTSTASGSTMP
eukprot:3128390-Rhodomonas_salina.1